MYVGSMYVGSMYVGSIMSTAMDTYVMPPCLHASSAVATWLTQLFSNMASASYVLKEH